VGAPRAGRKGVVISLRELAGIPYTIPDERVLTEEKIYVRIKTNVITVSYIRGAP
jgi:hypothetical protein